MLTLPVSTTIRWREIPSKVLQELTNFMTLFVIKTKRNRRVLTVVYCRQISVLMLFIQFRLFVANSLCCFFSPTQICREQFVALHSEPILEELQKHFHENYSGLE